MASILDFNSDTSDSEDDVDYLPNGAEESEDSFDDEYDETVVANTKGKAACEDGKDNENSKLTEEEQKKRSDDIFKKFLEDVESEDKPPQKADVTGNASASSKEPSKKVTVTEEYDFAGETVKVTKEVDASTVPATKPTVKSAEPTLSRTNIGVGQGPVKRSGGLSSVIGALGNKKQKISTLQKSMLDWNSFKKEEGIEEELTHHNKGKDGYIERQAFLQRSDLRQFEIEKNIRLSRKSKQ